MTAADSTALARSTDPATSHEAVPEKAIRSGVKLAIMSALIQYGPLTDEELTAAYSVMPDVPRVQADSIRKRRAELMNERQVEDSGERRLNPYTRKRAIVWRVAK